MQILKSVKIETNSEVVDTYIIILFCLQKSLLIRFQLAIPLWLYKQNLNIIKYVMGIIYQCIKVI